MMIGFTVLGNDSDSVRKYRQLVVELMLKMKFCLIGQPRSKLQLGLYIILVVIVFIVILPRNKVHRFDHHIVNRNSPGNISLKYNLMEETTHFDRPDKSGNYHGSDCALGDCATSRL
jgi:hypothetical protein